MKTFEKEKIIRKVFLAHEQTNNRSMKQESPNWEYDKDSNSNQWWKDPFKTTVYSGGEKKSDSYLMLYTKINSGVLRLKYKKHNYWNTRKKTAHFDNHGVSASQNQEKVATYLTTHKLRILHRKISRKWTKDDTK